MTIEQTVVIPADYRISIELPRSIPVGAKARVEISIPTMITNEQKDSAEIENVRKLLQQEMTEKGTSTVMAASGEGWEVHVREHYAES